MEADPGPLTIVALEDRPDAEMVRVAGDDAAEMLMDVRHLAGGSRPVLIAPDAAAEDIDDWIGIVAAAVVEGVTAVETRHAREARRILTMHRAISTGGEGLGW